MGSVSVFQEGCWQADCVKHPHMLTWSGGCGEKGRKEGWKEEKGEGSPTDKNVPKKKEAIHTAHIAWSPGTGEGRGFRIFFNKVSQAG